MLKSNQWAAWPATTISTDPSATMLRYSAVATEKETLEREDGVLDWACFTITSEGSVPITRVKEGENSRAMRPWPQPRSRRRDLGPRW